MSDYGQVLDVLLFTDPKSGFFFGNGMAVLNTTPPAEVFQHPNYDRAKPYYKQLTHNMDFMGERRFYATWRNMPSYCIYCHDLDHLIDNCNVRPVLKCWKCDGVGHLKSKCTLQQTNNGRKKPKTSHHSTPDSEFSDDEEFEKNAVDLTTEAERTYNEHQTCDSSKDADEQINIEDRRSSLSSLKSGITDLLNSDSELPKESDDMDIDDQDNSGPNKVPSEITNAQKQVPTQKAISKNTTGQLSKTPTPKTPRAKPQNTNPGRMTRAMTRVEEADAMKAALEERQRQEQRSTKNHTTKYKLQ